MQDAATWIAFNLPVGVVMTLMDNDIPVKAGDPVWNLKNCGRCIDLVGTGQTESVDLTQVNMNDCISSFFWRRVDLNLGAIELYDDVDFKGNRLTLFLAEWPVGTIIPLSDWWLNDRVSAVRWTMLHDLQTVALFENTDGTGRAYQNIKGWGVMKKEVAAMDQVAFSDVMSAFSWDAQIPVKEIIAPISMNLQVQLNDSHSLSQVFDGTNNGPSSLPVDLTLSETDAQQLTVTDTTTNLVSTKIGVQASWDAGVSKGTLTFELTYTYTKTDTKTTQDTTTINLGVKETVNVVAYSSYSAKLIVQIGKVPPTTFKTTADRWYAVPVTGSTPDGDLYKRTEQISGNISGGLQGRTTTNVVCTPLPGHENDPQFKSTGGKPLVINLQR